MPRVIYRGPYVEGQSVRLPNGFHAWVKPGEVSPDLDAKVAAAYVALGIFELAADDEGKVIENG